MDRHPHPQAPLLPTAPLLLPAGTLLLALAACGGDGAGYCWGANDFGQLGDGNEGTPSDRPVRVAAPD